MILSKILAFLRFSKQILLFLYH